ncbi:MAG: hypothetical protein IPP47_22125 [Bryobacterales bacterium]|nr:hypothetical protein [Bryobacterales bacterium]
MRPPTPQHLAATAGAIIIIHSRWRPSGNDNEGIEVVLRAASSRMTKVLLNSTSEGYGKSDKALLTEDDDLVLGPTSKGR